VEKEDWSEEEDCGNYFLIFSHNARKIKTWQNSEISNNFILGHIRLWQMWIHFEIEWIKEEKNWNAIKELKKFRFWIIKNEIEFFLIMINFFFIFPDWTLFEGEMLATSSERASVSITMASWWQFFCLENKRIFVSFYCSWVTHTHT
jgi:hypothetical protein